MVPERAQSRYRQVSLGARPAARPGQHDCSVVEGKGLTKPSVLVGSLCISSTGRDLMVSDDVLNFKMSK